MKYIKRCWINTSDNNNAKRIKYSTLLLFLASFTAFRIIFLSLSLPGASIGIDEDPVTSLLEEEKVKDKYEGREKEEGNKEGNLKTIKHDADDDFISLRRLDEHGPSSSNSTITTNNSDDRNSAGTMTVPSRQKSDHTQHDENHNFGNATREFDLEPSGVVILGMYYSGTSVLLKLLEHSLSFRRVGSGEKNFENGELVYVRWNGLGTFYPGIIIDKHDNHTFDILYDDASYELAVPKDWIQSKNISRLDPRELIQKQNDVLLQGQDVTLDGLLETSFDPNVTFQSWNLSNVSTSCGKLALEVLNTYSSSSSTPWVMGADDPFLSITFPKWLR
jgi:hypothetical protein